MTTDVRAFEESLAGLDVPATRTTAERLPEAIEDAIEPPAVAAPLPFEDLSLPEGVTVRPTPAELREAETGVTAARKAIAAYGTLVVQSRPGGDEPVSLYPRRHVAVVRESDVVPDVAGAIEWLADEFDAGRRSAVLATGVSSTGDMGEFVERIHGPGEVRVVVVTDR